jgi:hypothetical protein
MTEEDPFYYTETVRDETMLFCLDMSGKGLANGEIAGGLLHVVSYFAKGVENKDIRDSLVWLLEDIAATLRTEAPSQIAPGLMKNVVASILHSRAVSEGRLPGDSTQ